MKNNQDKDFKGMMMVDEFSIFDEEVEEAGQDQEVEAYCVKCKGDTLHSVLHRYDDEIRRVRCGTCDDTHAFRMPKGEEEHSEAGAAKKRSSKVKPNWEQVIGKNKKEAKPYHVNEVFSEMDIMSHPIFGKGFVSELIGYDKIEVTFEKDRRILIHNRQKLPIVLPEYIKEAHPVAASTKARSMDPLSDEHDFEEMIDLGEDLLLGNSTKLSPKAWAALHEEDEEEAPEPTDAVEDEDYSSFEVGDDDSSLDDDDDDEEPKKKPKAASKEKKKSVSSKKTATRASAGKEKLAPSRKKAEPAAKKSKAKAKSKK